MNIPQPLKIFPNAKIFRYSTSRRVANTPNGTSSLIDLASLVHWHGFFAGHVGLELSSEGGPGAGATGVQGRCHRRRIGRVSSKVNSSVFTFRDRIISPLCKVDASNIPPKREWQSSEILNYGNSVHILVKMKKNTRTIVKMIRNGREWKAPLRNPKLRWP